MTLTNNKSTALEFLTALSSGQVAEHLFSDGFQPWTITSGPSAREVYIHGLHMLLSLFNNGMHHDIVSITAEGRTVVVESKGSGELKNGDTYKNLYVFIFTIETGKISAVSEYFDPQPVIEKIMPLMNIPKS